MLIGYRTGDMWAPKLQLAEALHAEAAHFIDCVSTGRRPHTDGEAGLRIVRLLETASASMAAQGRLVPIGAAVT